MTGATLPSPERSWLRGLADALQLGALATGGALLAAMLVAFGLWLGLGLGGGAELGAWFGVCCQLCSGVSGWPAAVAVAVVAVRRFGSLVGHEVVDNGIFQVCDKRFLGGVG